MNVKCRLLNKFQGGKFNRSVFAGISKYLPVNTTGMEILIFAGILLALTAGRAYPTGGGGGGGGWGGTVRCPYVRPLTTSRYCSLKRVITDFLTAKRL